MRLLLACLLSVAGFWAASFLDSATPARGAAPPSPERNQPNGSAPSPEGGVGLETAASDQRGAEENGAEENGAEERGAEPEQIGRLIEKLGSPSYASRLRAKQKLQRLGLKAFEQLQQAQYHADSEIAMASRHLVSSLAVRWSQESDPPAVREALHEYGAQGDAERERRIEVLAHLPDRQALSALARLARYETDPRLSRKAALALMRQPTSEEPATRRRRSERLLETVGSSQRPPSQWLRVYASDLAGSGYSAQQWQDLIRQQRARIGQSDAAQISADVILELVRVCATRAAEVGQREAALKLVSGHLDLLAPTSEALMELAGWAIDHGLHPLVLELRERHSQMFARQPLLLYSAAEAFLATGDPQQADRLAEDAVQLNPLPEDPAALEAMSPQRIEEIGHRHRELGQELEDRGLFRWAEREYRHVIESLDLTTPPAPAARAALASMLSEQQRHAAVIEVLQPLVERIGSDRDLMRRLNTIHFNYRALRSSLELHRGLLASERGRPEAAKPHLKRAWEMDQANIDILIAMYRLDGGDDWNRQVRQQLRQVIQVLDNQVRTAEVQAQQMRALGIGDGQLAQLLNQYAWLVCNTEGDYQKALRYSQRSLELLPEQPALLDTCARCYFAVGDLERAVATQRRAVRMRPHSPPLVRQLKEFEAKLEEEKGEKEQIVESAGEDGPSATPGL